MNDDEAQQYWNEYYECIKNRRVEEAKALWNTMSKDGLAESDILALDFIHFSKEELNINELSQQLEENYAVSVEYDKEQEYYCLKGTTRPSGIELDIAALISWVEFMCDVAQSYACVFSTWSIENSRLKNKWSNQNVDI